MGDKTADRVARWDKSGFGSPEFMLRYADQTTSQLKLRARRDARWLLGRLSLIRH